MINKVKINLHGKIGEAAQRKEWELEVKSVSEAIHAINMQSNDSLRIFFSKRENAYARYRVIVDEKEITDIKDPKLNDLTIEREDIKQIDIIPALEGAFFGILGIALGGAGLLFATTPMAMMTSLMLLTAGISVLLAKPPEPPEPRQIVNPSSDPTALANSYLFNGPVNVINEGGPVPLGYGRLIVGSQVIMSSYDVKYVLVHEAGRVR